MEDRKKQNYIKMAKCCDKDKTDTTLNINSYIRIQILRMKLSCERSTQVFQPKQKIVRVVVAKLAYILLNFIICKTKVNVNTLLQTAHCSINRNKVHCSTFKPNIHHSKDKNEPYRTYV
jgi:hypothetical protein